MMNVQSAQSIRRSFAFVSVGVSDGVSVDAFAEQCK